MKPMISMASVMLLLLAGVLIRTGSAASDEAAAIWAGEEAYWRYVQAHDNNGFRSLWADDFVGWPIVQQRPIHKSDIQLTSGSMNTVISYELHRESVDMHGPVGITFYRVTVHRRTEDGSESTVTNRLTHTWMKQGKVWQIVGGMSAYDPQPGNMGKQ